MRLGWLTAACILIAAPAQADLTARYRIGPGQGVGEMVIEVNGHGDVRASSGPQNALLVIDGTAYLLAGDLHGVYVARLDDLNAIMAVRFRQMFDSNRPHPPAHPSAGPTAPPPTISESPSESPLSPPERRGTETIAGRTGVLWSISGPAPAHAPFMEVVVSDDPDLAPIGRILARQFQSSQDTLRQAAGSLASMNPFSALSALLAHGTPLRIGGMMRLESVASGPVPAEDFVLPSPPLDRAALEARIMPAPAPRAATP